MATLDFAKFMLHGMAAVHNDADHLGLGAVQRLGLVRVGLEPSSIIVLDPIKGVPANIAQLGYDAAYYREAASKANTILPQSDYTQWHAKWQHQNEMSRGALDRAQLKTMMLSRETAHALRDRLGAPVLKRDSEGGFSRLVAIPLTDVVRQHPQLVQAVLPLIYTFVVKALAKAYATDLVAGKPLGKKSVRDLLEMHYTVDYRKVVVETALEQDAASLRFTFRVSGLNKYSYAERDTDLTMIHYLDKDSDRCMALLAEKIGDTRETYKQRVEFVLPAPAAAAETNGHDNGKAHEEQRETKQPASVPEPSQDVH